jgi:predicted RNA-binding Zn ribbon-like protein
MAMIDMIRADEMSRFDRCANVDCDGIVLDLSRNRSRNRSRLYCSTACTNRAAAAAHRARQAE